MPKSPLEKLTADLVTCLEKGIVLPGFQNKGCPSPMYILKPRQVPGNQPVGVPVSLSVLPHAWHGGLKFPMDFHVSFSPHNSQSILSRHLFTDKMP